MNVPLVAQCDHHGTVPYHVVCIHLYDDFTREWVRVKVADYREVECDYICKACQTTRRHSGDERIHKYMLALCQYCVRNLLRQREEMMESWKN